MNTKKFFTMLSISLLILCSGSSLFCMNEDPPAPSPGGTPFHLDCVPPKKGFWRFFGIRRRSKAYPMAAAATAVEGGLQRVPTALAEMALADVGYHGARAACNATRGKGLKKDESHEEDESREDDSKRGKGLKKDESHEDESRVDDSKGESCRKAHRGKASHIEKAAALHGSRLAAYVLTQEIAQRAAPSCADPDYEKNRRAMAEEASADLLWSGIKDLVRATGLTEGLKSCAERATHAVGLDALPEGAQDIGKDIACAGLDLFGKALVKGTVVRPVSNRMVGEPEATGTRFGVGLQRSSEGGLSLRFDGKGASLNFEL